MGVWPRRDKSRPAYVPDAQAMDLERQTAHAEPMAMPAETHEPNPSNIHFPQPTIDHPSEGISEDGIRGSTYGDVRVTTYPVRSDSDLHVASNIQSEEEVQYARAARRMRRNHILCKTVVLTLTFGAAVVGPLLLALNKGLGWGVFGEGA